MPLQRVYIKYRKSLIIFDESREESWSQHNIKVGVINSAFYMFIVLNGKQKYNDGEPLWPALRCFPVAVCGVGD